LFSGPSETAISADVAEDLFNILVTITAFYYMALAVGPPVCHNPDSLAFRLPFPFPFHPSTLLLARIED